PAWAGARASLAGAWGSRRTWPRRAQFGHVGREVQAAGGAWAVVRGGVAWRAPMPAAAEAHRQPQTRAAHGSNGHPARRRCPRDRTGWAKLYRPRAVKVGHLAPKATLSASGGATPVPLAGTMPTFRRSVVAFPY